MYYYSIKCRTYLDKRAQLPMGKLKIKTIMNFHAACLGPHCSPTLPSYTANDRSPDVPAHLCRHIMTSEHLLFIFHTGKTFNFPMGQPNHYLWHSIKSLRSLVIYKVSSCFLKTVTICSDTTSMLRWLILFFFQNTNA